MRLTLDGPVADWLRRLVREGRYQTAEEAAHHELLHASALDDNDLRDRLAEARADVEAGRVIELDLEALNSRGRQLLKERQEARGC